MEYLISDSTDPAFNLALEQYVFDALPRDRSYLILWQNDNTVVVGKYQNTFSEIDADYVREHGVKVVRRLSGGGAVYHDLGNLNFTYIADAGEMRQINFRLFCDPVIETLASYGVAAEVSGRNDMTVDGKKFSGNAQYIKHGRVRHHGTIMIRSDLSAVASALKPEKAKMESKGVRSVRSRVANLGDYLPEGTTVEQFRDRFLETLSRRETMHPYRLSEKDLAAVRELKESVYDTYEWNYGRSPAGAVTCSERIEGAGRIDVRVGTDRGKVRSAAFSGDFFCTGELEELEDSLLGVRYTREDVAAALDRIYDRCHISGLDTETLVRLIVV